jgi:hypothetical protein
MPLPRDFLDEVETELDHARASLCDDRDRVRALEELRRLAAGVSAELRRPITVFDVVRMAVDLDERERRVELVRALRPHVPRSTPR